MAAPIASDLVIYGGTLGAPSDITSPVGGAIDTSIVLDGYHPNQDLAQVARSATLTSYYSVIYFQNNCTGTGVLNSAKVYNRAAAIPNSSAGVLSYVSTSTRDASTILTTGITGVQDLVTLTGTTPISGVVNYGIGAALRHESLVSGIAPTKCYGDITISSGSQILAVIYGTDNLPAASNLSTYGASAEFMIAVGATQSVALTLPNRVTAPATVATSAFSLATLFPTLDSSIVIPGGFLLAGSYIAIVVQYTAYPSMSEPISNHIRHFPVITGNPGAS